MRKIVCLILAAVLVFSLCACKAKQAEQADVESSPSSETASSAPESSSGASSRPEVSEPVSSEESSSEESSEPSSSSPSSSSASSSKPKPSKPVSSEYFTKEELTYINSLSAKSQNYWFGTVKDGHNRPNGAMQFQKKYQDTQNIACIAPLNTDGQKKIYLTFDMGWEYNKSYTVKILDTLKEKNVKAVFFVTKDYAKKSADMVRRMIDEGHIVGNHSVSHPQMANVSVERMAQEIMGLHNYILENFGYEMFLFRAPSGNFSEKVLGVSKTLGYNNVFWSFAYNDWDVNNQPNEKTSFELYMKCLHDGGIFLIHGLSKTNVNILGKVIDEARNKGFEPTLYDFSEAGTVS